MTQQKIIQSDKIPDLLGRLAGAGSNVLMPVADGKNIVFGPYTPGAVPAEGYVQTTLSPKESVFPMNEEVLRFRFSDKNVTEKDIPAAGTPTVVYGARPCDARAFATINAVYMWDYVDGFYKTRADATTIIGVSCGKADDFCFCTSTGGGPGDTGGSDILLTRIDEKTCLAEVLTDKGAAIVALAPELFGEAGSVRKEDHLAKVDRKFDAAALRERMEKNFDSGRWAGQSLRCIGCGACAYVCPACTCFDIQDEVRGDCGSRVRCWDSCCFSQFTMHTSGHNPREVQSQRWRQRLMHKFSYQPDRLSVSGCVGCGRCSRACPVDMNILEHLMEFMEERP